MNLDARYRILLLLLPLLLAAGCSAAPMTSPRDSSESPATPVKEAEDAAPEPTATSTPTPDPFPDPVLQVMGEAEVVYDWSSQRCSSGTIPDLPVRAFRDAEGQVQLIISHIESVRMLGPDLDQLQVDCRVVSPSNHDPDPAAFSDNEWIASTYTLDGETVYALVHDEYHGHEHPGQCPSGEYAHCWYNAVTQFVSTDGGASYQPAAEPPDHLAAAWPSEYQPDGGVYGMFSPSNIIQGPDDAYYAFLKTQSFSDERQTVCLIRTSDLSDPAGWRFWDGKGFDGRFIDPYRDSTEDAQQHVCPPLAMDEIGAQMIESVTYNEYLGRYVLVGISADFLEGREVWGFFYATSFDLVNWTHRKLLMEVEFPWTVANPAQVNVLYPVLLDPQSSSRNFETTGQTAYLYFTRNNFGHTSLDRDLLRIPVAFFPSP